MADALRRFVDWVSAYTLAPPGAVLRMAMSVPSALEAPKTEIVYRAAAASNGEGGDDAALKLTNARRRVLEQLKDGPALPAAELAHLAGVGTSVIKTMASIGLLEGVERTMRRSFAQPDGKRQGPELSPEQAIAAQGLVDKVLAHSFLSDAARWRAWCRQDGGLFRGHCRGPGVGPAGAGAAARDRADGAVAETLRGSLRRHAGVVAFRPHQPGAARDLARHRRGQGGRGGRRALGAVPAVRQPRPDRGRRGARRLVQAG